jgi:hypothetical protein
MRTCRVAITAAGLLVGANVAVAHDSHTGQDYTKYRQRNGASCCNGHDCRPTRYEVRSDGAVVMFPEGRAVSVPGDRVNQKPSDDGMAHWCGVLHRNGEATTFCAILPVQSASRPGAARVAALTGVPGY